ncbi:MAG: helix-hairpin-helix domain-containing protein, partial [Candidatus Caldatribacteriota bacterium]|nr:helix-hairpin-helix domain-containing protein [Candidatus Caldatribacteriota bacterium]
NINIVNSNALQSLPGIGPVLSEKIINYRNKNGLFETVDEIKEVSGIGEKKFEGIKDLICVY